MKSKFKLKYQINNEEYQTYLQKKLTTHTYGKVDIEIQDVIIRKWHGLEIKIIRHFKNKDYSNVQIFRLSAEQAKELKTTMLHQLEDPDPLFVSIDISGNWVRDADISIVTDNQFEDKHVKLNCQRYYHDQCYSTAYIFDENETKTLANIIDLVASQVLGNTTKDIPNKTKQPRFVYKQGILEFRKSSK